MSKTPRLLATWSVTPTETGPRLLAKWRVAEDESDRTAPSPGAEQIARQTRPAEDASLTE